LNRSLSFTPFGLALTKKLRASSASLRKYSKSVPRSSAPPERVEKLSAPPPVRPYSAGNELVTIWNSCTASGEGRSEMRLSPLLARGIPSTKASVLSVRPPLIEISPEAVRSGFAPREPGAVATPISS
jgi:hypothetical protein